MDKYFAPHSAYSYEDLPSDLQGAKFGAQIFDPKSKSDFGSQLLKYLNTLQPINPENAPNYEYLPLDDSRNNAPSLLNYTTQPKY